MKKTYELIDLITRNKEEESENHNLFTLKWTIYDQSLHSPLRPESEKQVPRKYELTNETREFNGHILHRIRAIKDFKHFFGNNNDFCIKTGTLGGFIENESNLDHRYGCWVSDDAMVYGGARVVMDALVYGNAVVYEQACVGGHAHIYDNAQIYGKAKVCGTAHIYNNAHIYENACIDFRSHVYENAHVYGNAEVGFSHGEDKPEIYGNARVYDNAIIEDNARIYGNAQVYGRARIREKAKVRDNAQACGTLDLLNDAVLAGDKKLTRGYRDFIGKTKITKFGYFKIIEKIHKVV